MIKEVIMRFKCAVLVLVIGVCIGADQVDSDLFRSDVARIELRKPSGWHFQSLESLIQNRASVKLNDEEFRKAIERMATTPLMIVTRHQEPYESLNPSLQVLARPSGPLAGKTGGDILRLVEPTLRAQFADFTSVEEIHDVTVGGQAASRLTARYTLKTKDGREFPTQATIVVVPRGAVIYQFGFSGPPEGPDALTGEVDAVLQSVNFLE